MTDELAKTYEQEPHYPGMPTGDRRWRLVRAGVAVAIALVSFFVLARIYGAPEAHANTIGALDEKRGTVMNLVGASTGSSAAISLLPGDAGTPIAEKLVDLSSDFLVVIAAIYLEKYLLTVLCSLAFRWLVPAACLIYAVATLVDRPGSGWDTAKMLAFKLALFGVAAAVVVPVSVHVSEMIERTYESSISETIAVAEQTTDAIEDSASEGASTDAANPLSFLLQMPEELGKLTDSARNSLNNFIEALAVMVVTSCLIPILVLVFFLWLAKVILGVNINLSPMTHRLPAVTRPHGRRH